MGWSRPRLQTTKPGGGKPEGLVELSAVAVWTNYGLTCITGVDEQSFV